LDLQIAILSTSIINARAAVVDGAAGADAIKGDVENI
jgi:hypothetical protein